MMTETKRSAVLQWGSRLCQPKIVLPNPLWWIVGYGVVYPWRLVKRAYRRRFPVPPIIRKCDGCGADIGQSLFGWCSIECLQQIAEKEQC